jgi:hypothetical protein
VNRDGRPPAIGMVHDVVAAADGGNWWHQATSGTVTVSSSGTPNSANQPSRA